MKVTENDLMFKPVRENTGQWSVVMKGVEVCLVTERVVASPTYALRFPNGRTEFFLHNTQEVIDKILAELNKETP